MQFDCKFIKRGEAIDYPVIRRIVDAQSDCEAAIDAKHLLLAEHLIAKDDEYLIQVLPTKKGS